MTEDFFYTHDGLRLCYRMWTPADAPKAIVVVSHGIGEHSGRYQEFGEMLAEKGYVVYAPDHRGFGRSEGLRGHVDRFQEYVDDLDQLVHLAVMFSSGLPVFLLGHSAGGLIGILYSEQHQSRLAGLVLSSPLLEVALKVPRLKEAVGRTLAKVLPRLTLPSNITPHLVTHDQAIIARDEQDPLVHNRVSLRLFEELGPAMSRGFAATRRLTLPCLIVQAGNDKLVSAQATERFFHMLTGEDKTFKCFDGWYHEVLNEVERALVYDLIVEWLDHHI